MDGLASKDTSWELWDKLRVAYDLEDKVVFKEGGVDSNNKIPDPQTETNNSISNIPDPQTETNNNISRPKRDTKKPNYLSDYV